jgi:hypothetical protein
MKKHTLILIIVVLVLLFLLWWLPRTQSLPSTGKAEPATELASHQSANATPSPRTPTAAPASQPGKLEFLRDLAQQSNRPIRFYGKVIDQDENPIPDVKVKLGIRTAKEPIAGLVGDVFDYRIVTTDSQGRFLINDAKGALLEVKSLEKPGYEASIKKINQAYWYWRDPSQVFKPDPDTPEVFRMWKKEGAEKLVLQDRMTRIPYNGSPVAFDLLTGRQSATGGDLRVTLLRSPEQIQWGQRNYDWTLTIEAVDGGVIESNDEQMFRAPSEGYRSKISFHMPANAPDWTDEKTIALYIKTRGGKQYGRVELNVMVGSDKPTTGFSFRSAVNPLGSRNLEYDPAQDLIKAPPPRTATAPNQ